jgi:alcohol oxidase
LHLLVESRVVRVIFDNSTPPRAIGVEYQPNEEYQPQLSIGKLDHRVIRARKLVVVTAGALGTPQILERSGVGNPEILKNLNIPVISDVPGVGESYQDHHLVLYPYKSNVAPEETLDDVLSGRKDWRIAAEAHDPILGYNGIGKSDRMYYNHSKNRQMSAPNSE